MVPASARESAGLIHRRTHNIIFTLAVAKDVNIIFGGVFSLSSFLLFSTFSIFFIAKRPLSSNYRGSGGEHCLCVLIEQSNKLYVALVLYILSKSVCWG